MEANYNCLVFSIRYGNKGVLEKSLVNITQLAAKYPRRRMHMAPSARPDEKDDVLP